MKINTSKKVLKNELFSINGCSKNYLLWEIPEGRGMIYEIIEEFKGHRISRAVLHGLYLQKVKAVSAFKKIVKMEKAQNPVMA